MKKTLLSTILVGALAFTIIGCGEDASSKKDKPKAEEKPAVEEKVEYYEAGVKPTKENNWGLEETNNFYGVKNGFEGEFYEGVKNYKEKEVTKEEAVKALSETLKKAQGVLDKYNIKLERDASKINGAYLDYYEKTLPYKDPSHIYEVSVHASNSAKGISLNTMVEFTYYFEKGVDPSIDITKTFIPEMVKAVDGRAVDTELVNNRIKFYFEQVKANPQKAYYGVSSEFNKENWSYGIDVTSNGGNDYVLSFRIFEKYKEKQ